MKSVFCSIINNVEILGLISENQVINLKISTLIF